jgi:hypothetical protein
VTNKAYEQKISAELQKAKTQLGNFEARAKSTAAQAEIDTINSLKAKHQEIDKKAQDLKKAVSPKVEQAKAEIDAEMAKLQISLTDLATRLKVEPQSKAS